MPDSYVNEKRTNGDRSSREEASRRLRDFDESSVA
jgi:hypothetical protein